MDKKSAPVSSSIEQLFGPLAELARHLPCFLYQLKQTPDQKFHYVYASENTEALFGIPAQAIMQDASLLLDRIHPADAERVYQTSAECAAQLKPWHAELRIIRPDERIVWLEAFDFPKVLPDGSILFSGFANDVSQRKNAEQKLRQSEAEFRALVESARDIIFTLTPDGCLTYVSPSWQDILGHHPTEVMGNTFDHFVHQDDLARCFAFMQSLLLTATKQGSIEYRIFHKNGQLCWHTSTAAPIFDAEGHLLKYVGVARDITEQKQQHLELAKQAFYDPLTGLANRTLFYKMLEQQLALCQLRGDTLALLFIDLDRFKPVNDCYGHAVGDSVLQQVAQRLHNSTRAADLSGRLSGDEFVVVLTGFISSQPLPAQVLPLAERIQQQISEPYSVAGLTVDISCSIGIALFPQDSREQPQLLHLADIAMYQAKKRHAGQAVCFYQPANSNLP